MQTKASVNRKIIAMFPRSISKKFTFIASLVLLGSITEDASATSFTFTALSSVSLNQSYWNSVDISHLGALGGGYSLAFDGNASGQIVGESSISSVTKYTHATLWENGNIVNLGTLGGNYSQATGINDNNQIVGYSTLTGDNAYHATLWENGNVVDLGTFGGTYSQAMDLNNLKQIVGYSFDANEKQHASVWSNGFVIDLNTLSILSGTGWVLENAFEIDGNGQIIGTGWFNGSRQYWQLTPDSADAWNLSEDVTVPPSAVPLPATLPLMLSGLGVLGFVSRRRRETV